MRFIIGPVCLACDPTGNTLKGSDTDGELCTQCNGLVIAGEGVSFNQLFEQTERAMDASKTGVPAPVITHVVFQPAAFVTDVTVQLEGVRGFLSAFTYYPDELSFTESELIGLTLVEAQKLKITKDVKYLQS